MFGLLDILEFVDPGGAANRKHGISVDQRSHFCLWQYPFRLSRIRKLNMVEKAASTSWPPSSLELLTLAPGLLLAGPFSFA
jgi:hypothetical protein